MNDRPICNIFAEVATTPPTTGNLSLFFFFPFLKKKKKKKKAIAILIYGFALSVATGVLPIGLIVGLRIWLGE